MRHTRRVLALLLAFVACALVATVSRAASPPTMRGTIALSVPGHGESPLELSPKDGGFLGEFVVENRGADPLSVSRVAIRGDDDDVRAPPKLTARFAEGGGTAITVPPGGSRKVTVTWTPDRDTRARQVFAHVVVTSTDESAGEVAMGITARVPRGLTPITDRVLSWLVFLPIVGAAIAFAMRISGNGDPRRLRRIAVGVTAAQCALALWMYDGFSAEMTRIDGNDGYQFIEHDVWIRALGVEYFLGVDGVSMPMVLLASVLGLVGALATYSSDRLPDAFFAMYLVLLAGVMGVFVSLDLLLFFFFWQVVAVALYFLIGLWGEGRREQAAFKYLATMLLGSALMLFAILALWTNADRTFLVDGTAVTRSFSIPELMRVAFHAKKEMLFGMPLVKVAWVSLFLSFGALVPIVPLHRWLPDALVAAPTPVAVLLAGLVTKLGGYGVLRVCFGVLPEASRWAAGTIVALGVLGILYGALCAMAQTDMKKLVAYATVSQVGFCLLGLGSLTPEGIAACLVQMASHGIVVAVLLLLIAALEERLKTRDISRLGGLGAEVPMYAALLAFALLASVGLPGLVGFWGEALALFGAFPVHRALVLLAGLGAALGVGLHVSAIHRVLLGKVPSSWRTDPVLASFGGRIPELTPREVATIAPLAVLAVALGVWPVPLLSVMAGGVRDATSLVNPLGPEQIALLLR